MVELEPGPRSAAAAVRIEPAAAEPMSQQIASQLELLFERAIDPPACFVFTHAQAKQAVLKQRTMSRLQMQSPFFDFGQMGHELGKRPPLRVHHSSRALEQLPVRQMLQTPELIPSKHDRSMTARSRDPRAASQRRDRDPDHLQLPSAGDRRSWRRKTRSRCPSHQAPAAADSKPAAMPALAERAR